MAGDNNVRNVLLKIFEQINSRLFCVIQIGAADGKDHLNDVILRYGKKNDWTCLFVEPSILYFNVLKETYKDTKYLFENSAISNRTEKAVFHRVFPRKTLEKINAIGFSNFDPAEIKDPKERKSFSKAYKRGSLVGSKYLLNTTQKETGEQPAFFKSAVDCLTLKDLLFKHSLKKLDFLHIDAEGYDCEIIKQIDFSSEFRPLVVCYEEWGGSKFKDGDDLSNKISLGPTSLSECRKLLLQNEYLITTVESEDTTKNIIAVDTKRLSFDF